MMTLKTKTYQKKKKTIPIRSFEFRLIQQEVKVRTIFYSGIFVFLRKNKKINNIN